jgi:hypothetical protein
MAEGADCEDCPPVGYPTDETRCNPCPRRRPPMPNTPTATLTRGGVSVTVRDIELLRAFVTDARRIQAKNRSGECKALISHTGLDRMDRVVDLATLVLAQPPAQGVLVSAEQATALRALVEAWEKDVKRKRLLNADVPYKSLLSERLIGEFTAVQRCTTELRAALVAAGLVEQGGK